MKQVFRLEGLCCANCAAKIERSVKALPGVTAASLNFFTARLTVECGADDMSAVAAGTAAIVRRIEPGVTLKRA